MIQKQQSAMKLCFTEKHELVLLTKWNGHEFERLGERLQQHKQIAKI